MQAYASICLYLADVAVVRTTRLLPFAIKANVFYLLPVGEVEAVVGDWLVVVGGGQDEGDVKEEGEAAVSYGDVPQNAETREKGEQAIDEGASDEEGDDEGEGLRYGSGFWSIVVSEVAVQEQLMSVGFVLPQHFFYPAEILLLCDLDCGFTFFILYAPVCSFYQQHAYNIPISIVCGQVQGSRTFPIFLIHLDVRLRQQVLHYLLTPHIGGPVEGSTTFPVHRVNVYQLSVVQHCLHFVGLRCQVQGVCALRSHGIDVCSSIPQIFQGRDVTSECRTVGSGQSLLVGLVQPFQYLFCVVAFLSILHILFHQCQFIVKSTEVNGGGTFIIFHTQQVEFITVPHKLHDLSNRFIGEDVLLCQLVGCH